MGFPGALEMVLYGFVAALPCEVCEVKYCSRTAISSAIGGFIMSEDSVGEVPLTLGNCARLPSTPEDRRGVVVP
jgi:hypothetical protein